MLFGTARHITAVTLAPEYAGATLTGDGTNNIGTMTSDFCSNTGALAIATAICSVAGDVHNYYSWTATATAVADYDIYVRYQVPSDFGNIPVAPSPVLSLNGWVTNTVSETDQSILSRAKNEKHGSNQDVTVKVD